MNATEPTDLILGTAGHIDHGKTSLIKRLTGTDTDRLPEEKRRGITIELGFAELQVDRFRLGIVDVPGHEKFVRQMLAGATGMDLAMLVVAADDSVKRQTREHLDVLRYLDLPAGVIALTKCDLADPDWIELVAEEVRDLVAGSFLEAAPIVRTSAATGQGIEQLLAAIAQAAEQASESQRMRRRSAPFRMAIDRAFTLPGHGTIVTGSVASGKVQVGDQLMIQPGSLPVRVRSAQSHDRPVESLWRGQRAAINLAGVHHEQVQRGHELAAPGYLIATKLMTVRLQAVEPLRRPIKNRARVRLHLGTAEVLANVRLLGPAALGRGDRAIAQLFLHEPVVAVWNQPFVLRSESPVETIAGGQVLVPAADKLSEPTEQRTRMLEELSDQDPLRRAAAAVYFAGDRFAGADDLARIAGLSGEETHKTFERLLDAKLIRAVKRPTGSKIYVHPLHIQEAADRICRALARRHDAEPLRTLFDRASLRQQFDYLDVCLFDYLLRELEIRGQVRVTDQGVGLADRGPKLSKGEKETYAALIEQFRSAGFQPPSVKACQQAAARNVQSIPQLIHLAVSDGQLVEVANEIYLHAQHEQRLRESVQQALEQQPTGLTVSQIRELLGTSRKFAVPFCEYLDRIGLTRRDGDVRVKA